MGFLFGLGGLAVWYLGGRNVLAGQMTLGALMAFLAYLAMFYTPLTSLAEATTWFSNFLTASDRIFSLLDTAAEAEETEPASPLPPARGRIEFQDVSFGYHENQPVLHDISFQIEPGQMIGVVGRSGSGKSTLVSLIGRLYEANAGRILVDGVDVRQMDRRQLRRRIGMVLQEPFLFRGSVAENITYGNPEATPEQTLRATKDADAHDFIMRMPFAYETQLGQGGSGLSGGERQRLSIARALLFDPPILILDEATASVDVESERAIREAIRRFARHRTTIVIAHRLSTLQGADRLLVFDGGRLVEQGTREELLALDGIYSSLVGIQSTSSSARSPAESIVDVRCEARHGKLLRCTVGQCQAVASSRPRRAERLARRGSRRTVPGRQGNRRLEPGLARTVRCVDHDRRARRPARFRPRRGADRGLRRGGVPRFPSGAVPQPAAPRDVEPHRRDRHDPPPCRLARRGSASGPPFAWSPLLVAPHPRDPPHSNQRQRPLAAGDCRQRSRAYPSGKAGRRPAVLRQQRCVVAGRTWQVLRDPRSDGLACPPAAAPVSLFRELITGWAEHLPPASVLPEQVRRPAGPRISPSCRAKV